MNDLNHPWRSLFSRGEVPEQFILRPTLPQITPLQWTLVKGFNTEDSLIDLAVLAEARSAAKVALMSKLGGVRGTANVQSETGTVTAPSTPMPAAYPTPESMASSKTSKKRSTAEMEIINEDGW